MAGLSEQELASIEQRHQRKAVGRFGTGCRTCYQGWPCETSRVVSEVRRLREQRQRLAERLWFLCLTASSGTEDPAVLPTLICTMADLSWIEDLQTSEGGTTEPE